VGGEPQALRIPEICDLMFIRTATVGELEGAIF
jgi:hypothetical protein